MYWWENQLISVKLRQKFLCRMRKPSNSTATVHRTNQIAFRINKVSKFCMDAGFFHVVEVVQYFMTKDTGDFRQIRSVACREYTFPWDDGTSHPRGWIQGKTKIGPVLEIMTSYLYGKRGIEIRIWYLRKDNSHSWVRISHGSSKFVIDSNCNTENSCRSTWRTRVTIDCQGYRNQIKGESKTTKKRICWCALQHSDEWKKLDRYWTRRIYFLYVRFWRKWSIFSDTSQIVQRGDDGAVQFWIIKELSSESISTHNLVVGWSLEKHAWQQQEERKGDISIALMIQAQLFISELFKDIQDATLFILHYKTIWQFRVDPSNKFIT